MPTAPQSLENDSKVEDPSLHLYTTSLSHAAAVNHFLSFLLLSLARPALL